MGAKEALAREFAEMFGRPPGVIAEAPGRVNLLGEHTDYNDGFVLPAAIDRTVMVAGTVRDDRRVHAYSLDYGLVDEFELPGEHADERGWRDYVRGVAFELAGAHSGLRGADLAIRGDVPQGAGLSSSAAIEVAVAGALLAANGIEVDPRDVALAAHAAENGFVGVPCGIMDQFAAALSRAGAALLIDCRSLIVEEIPIDQPEEEIAIAVIDSGVARRLDETPYAVRRHECAEAARVLGVDSLRDAEMRMLDEAGSELAPETYLRARHVISEDHRVLDGATALRRGDVTGFGRLMYESHESLRTDFKVSTPELDALVEIASEVEGVFGARLTGAGFGGCVVVLIRAPALPALEEAVSGGYVTPEGRPATVWRCRPSDGLRVASA